MVAAIFRLAIPGSAEDAAHPWAAPLRGPAESRRLRVVFEGNSNSVNKCQVEAFAVALAAKDRRASELMADPKGGAHGCAPSSAEPWMASLEINDTTRWRVSCVEEGRFLLVTFLCGPQRKVTRAQRESV